MQNDEFAKSVREYLLDYIKFADAKATAVLTIVAGLGSVVGFSADKFLDSVIDSTVTAAVATLLIGILVLSALLSAYYCIRALSPSTPSKHGALCSFPDIAAMNHDDYVSRIAGLSPDMVAVDLASHTHTLSTIAGSKFSAIRVATKWLAVLLITVALLVVTYAADRLFGKEACPNGKPTEQNSSILLNSDSEPRNARAGPGKISGLL
jgi:hypothetical protein